MSYAARVAVRHVGHLIGWLAGCAIATAALGVLFGKGGVVMGSTGAVIASLWLSIWLPRSAHRAFETARYRLALRRYRVIHALAFTVSQARAAQLSIAAAHLAAGRHRDADTLLAAIDPATLDNAEHAVWLNNRACAALDAERDAHAALVDADRAVALRPDVPGILHTRARALIAVGRHDDAIAVLEAMRAGGELPLRLEAERCRELAAAWEKKGQRDYAEDYRDRARLVTVA